MRRQENHKQQQQQGTDDEMQADAMQADAATGGTSQSHASPTRDTETHHEPPTDAGGDGGKRSATAARDAATGAEEGVEATHAAGAALAETAGPGAGKRRTDQAGVQSAKERYLARKLQKTS